MSTATSAADLSTTPAGDTGGSAERGARWPWALAFVVVVLALVAGTIFSVISYRTVQQVDDEAAAREAVATAATQFARRANNYTSDEPQVYEDQVLPLLTTSYQQEWRTKVSELRAYAQQDATVSSTGEVTAAGVVSADDDSATVLVTADTSVDVAGSPLLGALRWEVDLFEVDGRWLVNDYRRVGPGGVVS